MIEGMEVRTLCDVFHRSLDSHRKRDFLKSKRGGHWRDVSTDEFRRGVHETSAGLRVLGIEGGDRVAILSENRPEWVYTDLGTLCAAAVVTPIYATLPAEQVLYILNDSEAKVVVVSTGEQAAKVAEVRAQARHLEKVVVMEPAKVEDTLTFEELRARGARALASDPQSVRQRAAQVTPDDLATLIYTSGTTGQPKGVMLTHGNIVSNVLAAAQVFPDLGPDDLALSFLPLCHAFERTAGYYVPLHRGMSIAYAESVETVAANMGEVRPTIMCAVPRLYEKMYAKIREKVASDPALRRKIFEWAIGVGAELFDHKVKKTEPGGFLKRKAALADKLVFSKIRERTGGRLRMFISGGAPLAKEIAEFFGAAGLLVVEGYGLTETSPVITANRADDLKPGTVGKPVPGVEVKIAPDGEILTRGPHVMRGYFKRPEDTAATIEKDGWLHTGDIGSFDDDGFLRITDRKKDIIVTSGGKNLAPQPIENVLKMDPLITEVVMVGNKRHFPAALIVPAFEPLEAWAKEQGLKTKDRRELVKDPAVVAHYQGIVDRMTGGLAQFERIKKIALVSRDFTVEAGELTPTLKVRRKVVEEKYRDLIDGMYGVA
jgi:long-chain acyl-CoA synthetase